MSVHAQTEPELPKGLGPSSCVMRLVGLAIGFGSVCAQTEPELAQTAVGLAIGFGAVCESSP
jgi:hypothetical protein